MSNLLLTILHKAGVNIQRLGDIPGCCPWIQSAACSCRGDQEVDEERIAHEDEASLRLRFDGDMLFPAMSGAASNAAVIAAARSGDIATLRTLIAQRADVNASEADGTTALHWAVQQDNVEAADLLIRAGADVKAAIDGVTPLWAACTNGNAGMIERLLNAGADPTPHCLRARRR